jgi:hypothetical protein
MKPKILTLLLLTSLITCDYSFSQNSHKDSTKEKSYSQEEYWKQKEELRKEREKIFQDNYSYKIENLNHRVDSWSDVYKFIISCFVVFGIIVTVFGILSSGFYFMYNRQQKVVDENQAQLKVQQTKLTEQQSVLEEQQNQIEKKQEKLSDTINRVLITEDWGINIRSKAKIKVIILKEKPVPQQLERVFIKEKNAIFTNVDIIETTNDLSTFELNDLNTDLVVLINNLISKTTNEYGKVEERYSFDIKTILPFSEKITALNNNNIAFMLIGRGDINTENRLITSATMYSQVYQNLMNLLKFQSILRGELDV